MSKEIPNLVIVESPAKAHTITGYLGDGWTVIASVGHIRSIAKDTKDKKAIDTAHDFATIYAIDPEKTKTVRELKSAVKKAKKVWLATDEDREGEAIAWHLCEVLGLDPATTNRVAFHEITKPAIEAAIKNPRTLDMDMVKAQQARQILDRLVGFELSPVVWKKVPGGKSAGRVQSPAVKLLVEREREIAKFALSSTFKVSGIFAAGNDSDDFKAQLSRDFDDENSAKTFLASLDGADFTVADVAKSDGTRNPLPPFTTSTLQQDANARLGLSSRGTMALAQGLYQGGFITYMRTDSLNLSNQFLGAAGNFITKTYGEKYLKIRKFKTKSAGAQEAHEAIRPTDPTREKVPDARAQKLYDLIRNRTLASQMASAKIARTSVDIAISGHKEKFVAKGETVVFPGFLRVYGSAKDAILPALAVGEKLRDREITARQTFAKPPARYTEGSLVKKLEELEIGRPSTYATIISTIQNRGYAIKGDSEGEPRDVILLTRKNGEIAREIASEKTGSNKGKLVPTPSGSVLTDFLNDYFAEIDDYDFTAKIENELDEIAEKKLAKEKMLREFYDPFHQKIADSDKIERSAVAGAQKIGDDPKTGEPIFARIGRFGPLLVRGDIEAHRDDKTWKPTFANFPKNATMESISLESALKMFELPREVGELPEDFARKLADEVGEEKFAKIGGILPRDHEKIVANIGRFGPYLKVGKIFVSIAKISPFKISYDDALEKVRAKFVAEANKTIADWGEIKILNGRWGAYITDGTKNAKVAKDLDPAKITEAEAKKLLAAAPEARKFSRRKTATTKKSATTKSAKKSPRKTTKKATKRPAARKVAAKK